MNATATTTVGRSRRRGPWLAILFNLSMLAAVLAAAGYLPGWLADSPPAPPARPGPTAADQAELKAARPQATLVEAEDNRLLSQLRAIPWNSLAYLDRAHGAPTLILTARHDPYTLESLLVRGAARRVDATTVALTTSVLVGPGARLTLDLPDNTLRMTSTPSGFTSLVGWKGSIALTGTLGHPLRVTSWDPATGQPDQQVTDGRAYIRIVGADLAAHSVALSDLGFWSGRTGGLAVNGSEAGPGTGSITDLTAQGDHYGLFSSDTTNLTIADCTIENSGADGVLLYRGSVGATVTNTVTRGNAGSGIVADRGSSSVSLRNVTADHNADDGIRLDGRPLADAPSAAGVSLDGEHGFHVQDSTARFNAGNGVLLWDADDAVVTGLGIANNAEGIVVRGAASRTQISANAIMSSVGAAIAVRDGASDVTVDHNTIAAADTGIQVRAARVDVHDNIITAARIHGVSFEGAAHGSAARGNVLAGSGPSSLDLARLDLGAAVSVSNNTDAQWLVATSLTDQLHGLMENHPLLAVWAPSLLLPIIVSLLGRRRYRRLGRHAHPDPPADPARAHPEEGSAVTPPDLSLTPASAP